jgi:hypothetical protein
MVRTSFLEKRNQVNVSGFDLKTRNPLRGFPAFWGGYILKSVN